MRLKFATQADAQAVADRIHKDMCDKTNVAYNAEYAASVAAGQTKQWAIPFQDWNVDKNGARTTLVSPNWYVTVQDRCVPALTAMEVAEVGL